MFWWSFLVLREAKSSQLQQGSHMMRWHQRRFTKSLICCCSSWACAWKEENCILSTCTSLAHILAILNKADLHRFSDTVVTFGNRGKSFHLSEYMITAICRFVMMSVCVLCREIETERSKGRHIWLRSWHLSNPSQRIIWDFKDRTKRVDEVQGNFFSLVKLIADFKQFSKSTWKSLTVEKLKFTLLTESKTNFFFALLDDEVMKLRWSKTHSSDWGREVLVIWTHVRLNPKYLTSWRKIPSSFFLEVLRLFFKRDFVSWLKGLAVKCDNHSLKTIRHSHKCNGL